MEKPTLPKGTRDFGPAQMAKRQYILNTIRQVFQKYGFQPLETPAMENLSTLTGKYGEEGDQLLFKVLESGDFLKPVKFKLLGVDPIELSQRLVKNLKVVREKIHEVYITGLRKKDSLTLNNLKESWNNLELVIFGSVTELSEEEEKELEDFLALHSNQINISILNDLKNIMSSQITTDDEDFYFSIFEKFYINESLSLQLSNFLLERSQTNENTIKNVVRTKSQEVVNLLALKGLRYDLTVPFARYVVMNRNEVTFPFKRYQIQPVWRADRPQKGRYREFYQCDADVVGTDSLICEAEIVLMIKEVFKGLGIEDYSIKINHRAILSGLAELSKAKDQSAGQAGNESSLFVAIDKLDKIGEEKVKEELRGRGFSEASLITLFEILNFKGTTQQKIEFLSNKFSNSPTGQKGITDFKEVLNLLSGYGATEEHVEFDIALARGLSYYTGCIFEVKINNVSIGSVSGGGRYDNLTGGFGLPGVSGVGFSFGVDRLYDAMEELKLFPQEAQISSKVLITHFDVESQRYGLKVLQTLRDNGIASEIYPDSVKIQKQLDYANKKLVPYTIVIGSEEVKSGLLAFKNMKTGEQTKSGIDDILRTLK